MTPRTFAIRTLFMGLVIITLGAILTTNSWQPWPLFLIACCGLYGEFRSVKLPGYGWLNPGEGFYLVAACLYGPLPAAFLAAALGGLDDFQKKKRTEVRIFNIGWALSTFGAAGMVYGEFGLLGAVIAYGVVAGLLQAYGETHFRGVSLAEARRHQLQEMVLTIPAAFLIGYVSFLLFEFRPEATLLLILPLELLVTYVRTRELSAELQQALIDLESAQTELVAQGRKAALGVMAAGIAHEINNPLAAAVTNVHMLTMTANKSQKKSLGLLEVSLERCRNIVDRMLKYSRSTPAGGVPCDLVQSLNDATLFCGRKLDDILEIEADGGVLADPTELVQILSNLLANAFDSGASRIAVTANHLDGWTELRVTDNGSGIPEELREQIFDPFFTTKAIGSGTGLGLSISQGLAAGMGGELILENSCDGGSTFLLVLASAES